VAGMAETSKSMPFAAGLPNMKNMIKNKKSVLIFLIVVIIFTFLATPLFATTEYWYTGNDNYSIGPNLLFIDVTNNRVGIGDLTPDYPLDIETDTYSLGGGTSGTGSSYGIYAEYKVVSGSGGGAAVYGIASSTSNTGTGGLFSTSANSRAVFAQNSIDGSRDPAGYFSTASSSGTALFTRSLATSGTNYAVYAQAGGVNRGVSGYFYGGDVVIASGKLDVGCDRYTNACTSGTACEVNCPSEYYFATGGGCTAYNSPYTFQRSIPGNTDWYCLSNGGQIYAHVVCCRIGRDIDTNW